MQKLKCKKACICAVNASYTHSSLALINLRAACAHLPLETKVYCINDSVERVCSELFALDCDVYLFGCYIWNLPFLESLACRLKSVKPDVVIVFGGPEITYETEAFLKTHPYVDFCLRGEGERSVPALLEGINFSRIDGLCYKDGDAFVIGEPACIQNLDVLARVYNADVVDSLKNKLIYYETSRGCPFRCSYCLSSTSHGVRFFSLTRVFEDLKLFMEMRVPLVKLTDRTFNIDPKRTVEILRFILKSNQRTCFHFEVTADGLSQEMLLLLETAPKGWFQLEIGVQTTHAKTSVAIDRYAKWEKIQSNVLRLRQANNMHIHLDLIAGLPYEDYESFSTSFCDVFALKPDMLQLGFLKLLKGTKIRGQAEDFGYIHTHEPPYEVLASRWISYAEMQKLKQIENVLELYYNSGRYTKALVYSMEKSGLSAFAYFEALSAFWQKNTIAGTSYPQNACYALFHRFHTECIAKEDAIFDALLTYEAFKNNKTAQLAPWMHLPAATKTYYTYAWEKAYESNLLEENLLAMSRKEVLKYVRIVRMEYDVFTQKKFDGITIFDYLNKKTYSLAVEDYEENNDGQD